MPHQGDYEPPPPTYIRRVVVKTARVTFNGSTLRGGQLVIDGLAVGEERTVVVCDGRLMLVVCRVADDAE